MSETANADMNAENITADYLSREGVKLNHEAGDRAFYRPSTDSITLPTLLNDAGANVKTIQGVLGRKTTKPQWIDMFIPSKSANMKL